MKVAYRVQKVDLDRVGKLLMQALLIGVGIGAAVMLVITTIIFSMIYKGQKGHFESRISVVSNAYANLSQEYDSYVLSTDAYIEDAVKEYKDREVEYENTIHSLGANIDALNDRIDELSETKEQEFEELRQFWYVFKNAPADSGLTIDQLKYSIEQCEIWDVNPRLMWAIYDVESDFNPKADSSLSSARGLGQILESTATSYYEDVLEHGRGSYTHSMAYDPYVNIEISTCIMGRNLSQGSLEDAVWLYGDRTDSYYGKVLSAVKEHGYTISDSNARFS